MRVVFDTYRNETKEIMYGKVINDSEHDNRSDTGIMEPNRMFYCKKESRKKTCEKLIFEYCIMSDRFLELYSLDSRLDVLRYFQNLDLMDTMRRDMIFALADVFCQHISYMDACLLIEAEKNDEYADVDSEDDKIPHSEAYRATRAIGRIAVEYFENCESTQIKKGGFPQFNTSVITRWNKEDRVENLLRWACADITSVHLGMVDDVLANCPDEKMIADIQRKMVMAIAGEYGIEITEDEINKIVSLDGIILTENEMNNDITKTAIIGKEAINFCCKCDEL